MDDRVDDREVQLGIRRLMAFGPRAMAEALNKTAFELRDAEADEALRAFDFSSASTAAFVASPRSFVFSPASESALVVEFKPKDRIARLLIDHMTGRTRKTQDAKSVQVGGRPRQFAAPVNVQRSGRGSVPKSLSPGALLERGSLRAGAKRRTVFVIGNALVQRVRGRGLRTLYALATTVKIEQRLRYLEVARETVRREFPIKARVAWSKFSARR